MHTKIESILPYLCCPDTSEKLVLRKNYLQSESGHCYAAHDDIWDLTRASKDETLSFIEASYKHVAKKHYESWVDNRWIIKFTWGSTQFRSQVNGESLCSYPAKSIILDVPSGTGLFSREIYLARPDILFLAVDYSMEMLRVAKKKCEEMGIKNVIFLRGDVSKLPFLDNCLDGCISLNGFHSFPEPQKGALEIRRCLKMDASLLVAIVCSGKRRISDFMIKRVMIPKGYFYNSLSVEVYRNMLIMAGIEEESLVQDGAIMYFRGRKKNAEAVTVKHNLKVVSPIKTAEE